MKYLDQRGSVLSVVMLSVCLLLLVASLGFGGWAYTQMQDYKTKSDQKSAQAVKAAEELQKAKLEKEFAEKEKQPTKTYTGPETYGSISYDYPKSWSAYIDETSKSGTLLNSYLYPNFVPNLNDTSFALRIEVVNSPYDQVAKSYDGSIKNGKLTATAYVPEKLKNNSAVTPGLKMEGEVASKKQGSIIIIKLRDKTLKLWTESNNFKSDFNSTILPSLTFVP